MTFGLQKSNMGGGSRQKKKKKDEKNVDRVGTIRELIQ